ncbi:MAG TPA: hypothetical protein VF824_16735 [Thermoanaerobaculia bacterium]|jgi:hypothetical protein
MPRQEETKTSGFGGLRRAADAVKQLFSRGRSTAREAQPQPVTQPRSDARPKQTAQQTPNAAARPVTRQTDIPLDVLDRSYTPPLTSSKAGFRSDGVDHHLDQEFGRGIADDRWNDEDRITNKSGDPRIGTHRRTYEPAEARDESRDQ